MKTGQIVGIVSAAAVIVVAFLAGGYSTKTQGNTDIAGQEVSAGSESTDGKDYISDCTVDTFDTAVFLDLLKDKNSLVFSPYSLKQCMGLMQAGMDEGSDASIFFNEATGFIEEKQKQYEDFKNISGTDQFNGAFADEGVKSSPEFESGIKLLGASLEKGDLGSTDFMNKINSLVWSTTSGQIQGVFSQPPACDALFLNVIHLKEKWLNIFGGSEPGNFNGRTEQMMESTQYAGGGSYKGMEYLDLEYIDVPLAMRVVIPENKKKKILDLFKKCPDTERAALMSGCDLNEESGDYHVTFPKLTSDSSLELTDLLKEYFPDAFASGAMPLLDEDISVSRVWQEAVVENTERGTEASAVTVEEMNIGAMEIEESKPKEFKVDCPYIYSIYNTETNAVYFMGYQD